MNSQKLPKQPSVMDFFQRFPTEDAAREYFETARFPQGLTCIHCNHSEVWKIRGGKLYTCKGCRKQFTIRTGTVMEDSKISLQKWLFAMYLMTVARKGISSVQLSKELGITQKSAWHMAHRIRESCVSAGLISDTVECDETFIGGKEKNKHESKKLRAGRGGVGKSVVFGMRGRKGTIRAVVVKNTDSEQLHGAIKSNVALGSKVFTDSHKGYYGLNEYRHAAVNHGVGEYVRGEVHTNGMESFWAILKRAHYGTFHKISKKHLARYVREFEFKQNTRTLPAFDVKDAECGINTVRAYVAGMEGKKLTYKVLISNV